MTRLDRAQTTSYLKTTGSQVGLLFNFGGPEPEFGRVFFTPTPPQPAEVTPQDMAPDDLLFPELVYQIVGGLFDVHNTLGPGFIHRIYASACYREMQGRGLETRKLTEMAVFFRGEPIGTVKLGHMLVEGQVMLFPMAVSDERQIQPENLRVWMASQGVRLGIVANFHAERVVPVFMKEEGG